MQSPGYLIPLAAVLFLPAAAPAATLVANPTSITFAGNACFAQTQNVQITASDKSSIKVTVSLSSGSGYSATSSSAQTPAAVTTLTITAFSSASATGSFKISSSGLADLTLPVAFTLGTGPFTLALCGQGPVSKLPVTFSQSASDKATPVSQDVTLTASGSGSHKFTSTKDAKWLSISPDNGTVTGGDTNGVDIQVIVDSSGLPHSKGTPYNGNVTISAGGQNVTIAVTLSVTGCDVTVIAQPIPNVTPNHQVKSSVTLGVDVATAENVTFAATTSDGGKWLTVTNSNNPSAAGTATIPPDNLTVSVDATNLKPGNYKGTIGVGNCSPAPCTTAYQDIAVTVAAATLNATGLSAFSGTAANPPLPQTVQITASDGSAVSFTFSVALDNGLTWLQVKPTGNLTTPVSLSLTATPGTLAAGSYKGTIQLTPSNGAAPLSIGVTLNIIPTVTASPASLSFPVAGATPLQQTVSLTSDSSAAIGFSHTATTTDGVKWLNATAAIPNVPTTLTVVVSPAGLKPGNYSGTIQISPNGGPAPVSINVSYTVGAAAVLSTDTSAIAFSGQAGGSSCGQVTRSIQSSDTTQVLAYQAIAAAASPAGGKWLTVTPSSGNTPDTLTVSCNTGTLAAGSYSGTVSVSIPNSSNPAVSIPVTLNVAGPAAITPSATSLIFDYSNTTSASASGLSQVVNLTSASPVNFTAAVTSGQQWISVLPAAGSTNGSITITVDPSQLVARSAPYPGKVTIGSGANSLDINVAFQISGTSRLTRVAPLYLDGGGIQTSYLLWNPTTSPANYSISLAGATPGSGVISPASIYSQQTPGTAGQVIAGWSEITFDSGIGGLGFTQSVPGATQESAIPFVAAPVSHFFVPFDNTNGRATSLNVVERAPGVTATCNVNGWTSSNGSASGVATFQAAPRVSQMFDVRLWGAFNNDQGVAELICDHPVFAAVVRANQSGSIAVHDVVAAGPGDRTAITRQVPAVLDGASHQTILALVNTDNVDQAYSFQFWNNRNDGALPSPLEPQTNGSIPPGGVLFLATDGTGAASAPLAQLAGPLPFAELTAARTVAAFVIYQQGIDGSTISAESAVPATQTAAAHWTVPVSGANGFSTAVNIVNSNNSQPANLTLTYYLGGGSATETVSVPAGGSLLLQTSTDPVAAGLDGILDLVSDQTVNATVFRIAPDGSFAAFPPFAAN